MEMYLLTDEDAIAAIEERARAGVDVRVILETAPYLDEGANLASYERLGAAGVRVRWASDRFRYTHAKAMIVDGARLVVMTLNLTASGLGGGNREYAVVDDDPEDVAAATRVFAADEVGEIAVGGARLVTSPDGSRGVFSALVAGAATTLELESEELNDPDVRDALTAARARDVAVTVVLPGTGGAPVVHAKAMVADRRTCYVGSANFSPTSLDRNREMGLLIDDATVCGVIGQMIAADALY
jgi:phosphatidylserine/phosphatidylglycerophosphate/cardiolipin synthase-like enzyme